MKRKFILFSFLLIFTSLIAINFVFANQSNVKINATEVDIYFLEDRAKELGVQLPSEYQTSFKLEVTGTNLLPDYSTDESGYIKVSEDGVISSNNVGSKECIVNVLVGNEEFTVKVNVIDYLDIYVDNIFKNYIKDNISNSMSEYEKMKKICEYVVKYEYNTSPNYKYLSLLGGGDCIASSTTIIKMCEMVGIKAYERYAAFEPGAGNNHRNVTAILDGEVYAVDAGYNEPAPRTYTIDKEEGGFTFGWEAATDAPLLIQYNGFEENVIVPDKFSRKKIEGIVEFPLEVIGEYAFERPARAVGGPIIRTVELPSTIEKICSFAFADCKYLTSINIPENLSEIGKFAFSECENLTTFDVDPNNPNYTFEDGILYNKDKTEVILCAPGKKGEVVLDDNVTTIKEYAFYRCKDITGIVLGDNVKTIEPHAFEFCNMYGVTIPKSVESIGEDAFANSYVRYVKIEDGCQAPIVDGVFFACGNLVGASIPSSVPSISANAFRGSNNVKFYIEENSPIADWAQTNNKSYDIVTSTNSNTIVSGMIILKQSIFIYDGSPKTPDIVVIDGGKVLKQDTDYTVEYKDNINAHTTTPTVIVKGIGSYSGTAEKTFTISKITSDFTINVQDVVYGNEVNVELIGNNAGYKVPQITYNTVRNIQTGTKQKPTDVGEYFVYVSVIPENYNYKSRGIWAKFKILPAENEIEIRCDNVLFGNQPKVIVLKNKSKGNITYYYKEQSEPESAYSTNVPTQIGKYTVKAVSEKTANYLEGVATADFEICEAVYQKGDINKDGKINAIDASLVLDKFNNNNATTEDLEQGDMNNDGKLNSIDASLIIDIYYTNN